MKINTENMEHWGIHELIMSAVLPRPIAFVSTVSEDGVFNLAAFSCFNLLCLKPTIVAFSIGWKRDGRKKDTLKNIEFSKDFVINVVTENLAVVMNQASAEYPSEIDEFKEVGLTSLKADLVKAPLVGESPVSIECKQLQILKFGDPPSGTHVVIGKAVLIHVKDELWAHDHIELSKLKPIGRLGEDLYCRVTDIFEMKRIKLSKD
jgi:flavin reductase (DIM6/NTAB) family NADH-FMN oxidoreductase RutF